jgi:hypothetical protein
MPFQSEKQRRYLHANHPEIAKRWERDYAGGGRIPAHQAGIYGLAEGGRTGFRNGWDPGAGAPQATSAAPPGERGGPGPTFEEQAAIETVTPTGDGYTDRIIDVAERERREDLRNIVAQGEKTEEWEQAQKWQKPNKFLSFLGNAALAVIPGLLPAKLATTWNVGKLGWDITQTDRYDRYFELAGINKNEWLSKANEKMKTRNAEQDLYESFADTPNHPERIALQAELEIGKKTPTDVSERDGATQETNIKIENIEEVNDAKTQLLRKYQEMNDASRLAWLRQQEMNRAKQMAYWRMMMAPYMSAQGGRVPGGYNTGGLSNLFRLKNR